MNADALRAATPQEVAEAIGVPTEGWAFNCHGVSVALRAAGLEGRVRRGYTDDYGGQHSWVELPGGATIVDATAHAWRGGPPAVVFTDEVDRYDACGFRKAARGRPRVDPYDTERPLIDLRLDSVDYVADLCGVPPERAYDDGVELTVEQAFWLASLPVLDSEQPGVLSRFFAAEVYEAMAAVELKSLIPIDVWHYVFDEPYPGEPEREV